MVEQAGAPPSEAETSLSDSRAQFVASLGRRLEALRQALFALEQAPRSAALRDHLRRRIHAFGAAAGVLGFDRVFEAFREAEAVLARTSAGTLGPSEFGLVARTVDLVPSLVLGAAAPVARNREAAGQPGIERRGGGWPTSVLVFGGAALAEPLERSALGSDTASIEYERAEDAEQAESVVRLTAPDVAVIDADMPGARELMDTLVYDPLLDPVRIIALGTFDRPEAAASLVALGVARVLPKPVSPDTLRRAVLEVARERAAPAERIDPVGDVTVEALGERIVHEVRRGLVDAVKAQVRTAEVPFGAGTDVLAAVWSAVARIRELVTLRSGGIVRFDATGPEGAVPLAPWMGDDRSRSTSVAESRSADGVSLEGRTVIVVDDDPAVVWFISGLLRAAGADVIEAHDGAYALDVARKCWPDVIVSDILMPGLDGFALCREIKRDVALSDVPVILLSWKEDLLQRVRELGADAEGYLRKEATASTVVQRVREVLLPRARIEARLADAGPARGRLDGITPRLVLQLVCKKSVDARLTIRDAAYLYEVDVRRGRARSATRTSADGRFERGDNALSALLGVRAGRFAVTRDTSACMQVWDADLDDLITEHVERARAAQRALANPGRVAQVEIEEGALEPYLAATPLSAAALVRRLAEGVPPGDIIAAGASPRLLESVLVDLVLHGAIKRILGFDGGDLLAGEVESLRERRDRVEIPQAKDFRTPGPPVAGPVIRDALASAALAGSRAKEVLSAPASQDTSDVAGFDDWEVGPPAPVSADKPGGPDELFALLSDSIVPPAAPVEERPESVRLSMKGLAPPTSAPAEPSPLETALRSLPAAVSARLWKVASEVVDLPGAADAGADHGAGVADVEVAGSSATGAASAAVSGVGTTTAVSAVVALPAESPAEAPASPAPYGSATEASSAPQTAGVAPEGSAPPPTEPSASRGEPRLSGDESSAPSVRNAVTLTGSVDAEPQPVGESGTSASVEAAEGATTATPAPSSDAARGSATPGALSAAASVPPPETSEGEARTSTSVPPPDVEFGDAIVSAIGAAPPAKESGVRRAVGGASGTAKTATRTTPPAGGRGSQRGPRARGATPSKTPAIPPREGDEPNGALGIVAVMVVAAVATFALVTAVRQWFGGSQVKPAESAMVQTALPSATEPAKVVPQESSSTSPGAVTMPFGITVKDLELPPGLTVAPDRGLLEVVLEPSQSLYVDGVFIGEGPTRQVPLGEGHHEIRISGAGVAVAQSIDVHHGRRARLETSRAP